MAETMSEKKGVMSAEDVITKLKDDGDFDKLRLKIIQKLKENEELRNNIISTVKLSATLNREGAENLKPRQLADAIHEEIGDKLMGQISDTLWGVIRSNDCMKSEISETVESVYNKLLNPKVPESSPPRDPTPVPGDNGTAGNCSVAISAVQEVDKPSNSEPKEGNNQQSNTNQEVNKEVCAVIPDDQRHREDIDDHHKEKVLSPEEDFPSVPPGFGTIVHSIPPGFGTTVNSEQQCDATDEDPDVPPGFG